jgi:hypothetical protein
LGGDSGGVAADWLAVGTLPLSYTASKAELVQQRELLARWNVVDHEECPALAALSTLLRRRKEFLSKSEELLRTREEQSIMGEPEDSHGVLEYCQVSRTAKLTGAAVMERYIQLHHRTGHQKAKTMMRAVTGVMSGFPSWKNAGLTSGQIGKCAKKYRCPTCALNRKRDAIPANLQDDPADLVGVEAPLTSRNATPGEIISLDPCGLVNPAAQGKHPYWFIAKDVATGMDHVLTATNLNTETWKAAVEHTCDWYRGYGVIPKVLRCDADRIPLSTEFRRWLMS